jgi:hypothetical protein
MVDSTYYEYSTGSLDDDNPDGTGGTADTWASEDVAQPHYVIVTFPAAITLDRIGLYWAYNSQQALYMTSKTVDIDVLDNGTFRRVATLSRSADVPLSTIAFPAETTTQVRLLQPVSEGPPTYANILWLGEIYFGNGAGP